MSETDGTSPSASETPEFLNDPEVARLYSSPHLGQKIAGFFVLGFFLSFIALAIYSAIADKKSYSDDPYVIMLALAATWAGTFGGAVYVSKRFGSGSLKRDYGLKFKWIDIALGFGAALVAQAVTAMVTLFVFVMIVLFTNKTYEQLANDTKDATKSLFPGHGVSRFILIVCLVVLTPFVEEIFFRGLVFRTLRAKHAATYSILMGGFYFGVAHIFNQPLGVPALIFVGILFCFLAERTQRLGPSIIGHGFFNGITVFAQLGASGWVLMRLVHH